MSELPPLDAPQAYVVVGPDDQRGPYTMELLIGEVLAGRLSDATPVWWPGLSDWTTMGGHPGVAAEIERRRVATTAPVPGWVDPTPSAAPQPTYEPPSGGSVIDVEFVETVEERDPVDREAFDDLVQRSQALAQDTEQVAAAEQSFLDAASDAAASAGFTPVGREEKDGRTELRFDGDGGSELVLAVGRFDAKDASALTDATVPFDATVSSSTSGATQHEGTGAHGEVVVRTDEWSGRASSAVSLYLGLGRYFDESLRLDADAVSRDVRAVVGVLRRSLSD